MSKKNWITAHNDRNLAAQIAEDFSLNPFVALLLTARGITEPEQIENFLFQRDLFVDPFEITDMDKAVERIGAAVDNYERIMIFGDYDADGVTSTASLYLYLASQGADVGYYIPDRVSEGYGISCGSIREFHSQGVKLIVTVDNGINAVEETALANELGIDVVITDHHKVGDKLPEAVAVVNPHRADCECEYEDYAGVGVVLKLLCALEGDSDTILNEYADLAAIGTLADVVPLTGENRVIVKKGVELLNKRSRTGLEALKMYASVSDKILNSSQVSFSLAPRINAAGRMSSASLAMKLLLCTDRQDAEKLAAELEHANRERHSVEAEIAEKAIEYIEANDEVKYSPVIVVSGEGWHQGVIGIVASRLVSRYGKPAIVITTDGEDGKGSCRSIEGFSIYDALSSVSGMLTHFGGHTLAAGFGIKQKDIPLLREKLTEYCADKQMPFPSISVDFNIKPSVISTELLALLGMFEPFGANNPQPCFTVKNAVLRAIREVGEGKHLRLTLQKDDSEFTAMLFSTTAAQFQYKSGDTVDVAFKVERNEFKGEIKPSVHIIDIRFSDFDYYYCESSVRVYEKLKSGSRLNEKELKLLTPDRAFFASVYRFFEAKKSFSGDMEAFCHEAHCPYQFAGKALVTLEAMCELGLIEKDGVTYTLSQEPQKVDLNNAAILRRLEGRQV